MKMLAITAVGLVPLLATAAMGADDAKAREVRATAECVVDQDPASVQALLSTLPGSDEETRLAGALGELYTACSGDKFALVINKSSQGLYNGRSELAAAAASVELGKGGADMSRLSDAAAWYTSSLSGKTLGQGYDAVALGMQEFGTCVVKAAPTPAVQLIQSRAGTAEERQARAAIAPMLSGCVVQGKPLSIKVDQLRLMIAEPLYHAIVDGPSAGRRS